MKLNNFDLVILFGGGNVLKYLTNYFSQREIIVYIFTSPRLHNIHLERESDSNKFIHYQVVNKLQESNIFELLAKHRCLGLSFGSPWIFRKKIIDAFSGYLLNMHSMPLPKFQGGASISWMIMTGTREGNCLIHQVDEGIDTGKVLMQRPFRFPETLKKPIEFEEYLENKNIDFLTEFLELVENGQDFNLSSLPENQAIYFPRLHTDTHAYIDWTWDCEQIYKFITAFDDPYNGAITFINDKRIRIKDVEFEKGGFNVHTFMHGIIFRIIQGKVYVFASGGHLIINQIIWENDKLEDSKLNQIKLGDRFHTPIANLEEANMTRVFFGPNGILF